MIAGLGADGRYWLDEMSSSARTRAGTCVLVTVIAILTQECASCPSGSSASLLWGVIHARLGAVGHSENLLAGAHRKVAQTSDTGTHWMRLTNLVRAGQVCPPEERVEAF